MLGFISMLLVVFQGPLSKICISQNVASMWHPCSNPKKALSKSDGKSDSDTNGRKHPFLSYLHICHSLCIESESEFEFDLLSDFYADNESEFEFGSDFMGVVPLDVDFLES